MSPFHYKNGELYAESVPLSAIATDFGSPCYVYSRAYLEQRFTEYTEALTGQDHLVCYAVKANSNIAVLNVLARLGAGFDIVSTGELERVLSAGGQPDRIVFSGVGKTAAEMQRALEVGIHCFNVESEAELERLNGVAASMNVIAPISLRVNPDVDAKTHPYISTGLRDNKFGIDIERAPEVYRRAASLANINIKGVDCHIGSQLIDTSPFIDALDRVLSLVDTLASMDITISHLDLGGGLGVRYRDETAPVTADYIQAIREKLGNRKVTLMFEPGRSIAANAGVLLTKVEYLKLNDHKNFAIIDAAMNDMIRPSLYDAWMDLLPVQPRQDGVLRHYDFVGPVCETGDFLAKDRELCIQEGDLLALASSGAYGFTMSSNYNSRGRAAEVMVDGDQYHLVRARETVTDLMRGETVLP
ncbi:Diaminopimelate decarboxylase [Zhongshania aliphaticivorans]|uniref:Diaminopimelate decarboxylase n=1 Tax=Zhongshania aliphaticivorans TaxID=1470434 RepID=A0A5S9Q891_9GAMM|nr:diaminopimelate decarboxylase [Zhongshania aliphaticivorans]CAA0102976.1 Diaminopimelate decarboxylase [Zhongshania aliphaticivorans]CAA0113794.1 Diaminopimelate decarboxylase [Zhongshania aliphaticivorans]